MSKKKGGFPEIITLCGSTRFKEQFIDANKRLTLDGKIVISVGLFGHADGEFGRSITPEKKDILDWLHKKKIDLSDSIMVIDVNDYIGESTRSEIGYASERGKRVYYYSKYFR